MTLALFLPGFVCGLAHAQTDFLPSWNDGAARTAIEFPPMQWGASFNLEAVKAQIEKAQAAHAGQ